MLSGVADVCGLEAVKYRVVISEGTCTPSGGIQHHLEKNFCRSQGIFMKGDLKTELYC